MSLLTESYEDCVMMDKATIPDGYGGFTTVWTEGAPFKAGIVYNSSIQGRIAEQSGVTSLYTIATTKNINLQYHDVFKRIEDGKIFRVTSDGDDNKTPRSAALNAREVSAEEWGLSDDKITSD